MKETMTALFVRHMNRAGRYSDGGNLYLQVRKRDRKVSKHAVTKSWIFRYLRRGRQTWMGLGPCPDVSLAEARELATVERKKLLRGVDPLTEKRTVKQVARATVENVLSFAECAERYVDAQAPGWSNPKHVDQWRNTLKKRAGPVFGHLPVDQVDTEVGLFMQQLREDSDIASRALDLTILTAARTCEVAKAEWSEIDLDLKTWTVPGERMKSKREHRVPLSDAAVSVLQAVQDRSPRYVFPGHKRNTHLSNAAMLKSRWRIRCAIKPRPPIVEVTCSRSEQDLWLTGHTTAASLQRQQT